VTAPSNETSANPRLAVDPSRADVPRVEPRGFAELGLASSFLRALEAARHHTPTPIQVAAIPAALDGRDVLGCAQTGTGKTAAFALPILQRLTASRRDGAAGARRPIRSLILSPTRELAAQIGDSFTRYGAGAGLRHAVIFGGVGQGPQADALARGVDVLIACPGRLEDLLGQGLVRLDGVEILVLDEADRMLDEGFWPNVRRILRVVPSKRQTMLFSATMPPALEPIIRDVLLDPVRVAVTPVASTPDQVRQWVHFVEQSDKRALLERVLAPHEVERAIVFTRTKHGANRVAEHLVKARIGAEAIHGNKSQNARERALSHFRDGTTRVLVATDIAARGIDVGGITHVVNFDLPADAETYVHRIGRTARAGATGIAISFCSREERADLASIERLIRRRVTIADAPVGPLPSARAAGPSAARPAQDPTPRGDNPRDFRGESHARKPHVHEAAERARPAREAEGKGRQEAAEKGRGEAPARRRRRRSGPGGNRPGPSTNPR
jgi:ATP-dependent RNA helicase RhlE